MSEKYFGKCFYVVKKGADAETFLYAAPNWLAVWDTQEHNTHTLKD